MWDTAAELCAGRLAADPPTKELRDLVYIAETLQDMLGEGDNNATRIIVEYAEHISPEWGE